MDRDLVGQQNFLLFGVAVVVVFHFPTEVIEHLALWATEVAVVEVGEGLQWFPVVAAVVVGIVVTVALVAVSPFLFVRFFMIR